MRQTEGEILSKIVFTCESYTYLCYKIFLLQKHKMKIKHQCFPITFCPSFHGLRNTSHRPVKGRRRGGGTLQSPTCHLCSCPNLA